MTQKEISLKVKKWYDRGQMRDWDMGDADDVIDSHLPDKPTPQEKDLWGQIANMHPDQADQMWKDLEKIFIKLQDADISDEIEVGDKVDFGAYGKLYVVSLEASGKSKYFWVTDKEKERFNPNAPGWSILKSQAVKILDLGSNHDEDDYEEEEEDESMTTSKDVLKLLSIKNEAGSKKIDAMLTWTSSPEVEAAGAEDKASELLTGMLYMYDLSHMDASDALEIFDIAKKNSSAEAYLDGEMLWIAKDPQACAAALQKLAREFKLDIPRF